MCNALNLIQCASYICRNNFSGPKWKDRIILPETVYLTEDFVVTQSPVLSQNERWMAPSCDVLMETYHEGVSMIDIMTGASDQNSAHSVHNKELAALGLDAILKMVSLLALLLANYNQ